MGVVDASFDHPLKVEEKASMPLAGGIANMGYQCGMLWGAALAAGARAYRLHGPGPQAETVAIIASQRLVEAFRNHTKNEINCLEISHLDMQGEFDSGKILKFFIKGGPIGCFRMAAGYAPEAFNEINNTFLENQFKVPSSPVSCATMLAEKMNVSEMHAVMAAGLAGGIGLSGGGCGALGAAIWIITMDSGEIEMDGFEYKHPKAQALIDRFIKTTDYEFECSKIVGRKFEDVGDHAAYLRDGGCSNIIEALAA